MFVVTKSLFRAVVRIIAMTHFFIHYLWVSLNNFVAHRPVAGRKFPHQWDTVIGVIGDDAVVGLGDWTVFGQRAGFVRHFEAAIRKVPTVRRHWYFEGVGKPSCTSCDWLPTSTTPYRSSPNLFEFCFNPQNGALRNATVVCVMVGSNDTCDPDMTVANIASLADALASRGKTVFVGTTLVRGAGENKADAALNALADRARRRNAGLRTAALSPDVSFLLGPDLECSIAHNPRFFRFDGKYFSGAGYRKLGDMWAQHVHTHLTRIEWRWYEELHDKKN
eukprot:PhM_4_TR147/c0_g1_i1/m.10763